ncbi:beta-phosphoglucomutase [Phototrophicus methaneseepsis]|uniref:Beta-phosphoglucomutase n=1 Tax=Phototrophicus methaneseepsis TaxID=2710758 RepID=A0A7S8EAY2_9CHLR|nr:beta-phosphoglucomutase [Phototrophicus methaneseepsis]QPC83509.1 beta-phosphoglucomutase [Phototrophicus methaneseepsis]
MEVRALVFDLDGVITDTAEYHYLSWKRVTDEEGLPFSREDNMTMLGVSRRESLLRLMKMKDLSLSEEAMVEWMHRKNEYFKPYLENLSTADLMPGIMAFIEEARTTTDYKLGVASSSRNAKAVIKKLGLNHLFEVVGDAYTVANAKPSPDVFIWVAGALRVPMREVIVFEDARAGIEAAHIAGCASVGIGSTGLEEADLTVPTLEGLHVADVVEQVIRQRSLSQT